MVSEAVRLEVAGRLSEKFHELSARPLADRLLLVRQLAEQVRALHAQGRTHRDINPDTVFLDDRMRPQLAGCRVGQRLGGEDSDPEICPPDLSGREAMELPDDAAVAARLLENSQIAISPQRIDLYQLGVLLCRLVTGRSIREYMISPTVKNLVPGAAQRCLARAIGFDAEDPYKDCDALIAGLDEAVRWAAGDTAAALANTWSSAAGRDPVSSQDKDRGPQGEAPSRAAEADELPFRELGGFQVLARLGSGGMGEVYQGYDPSLDRVVALKVLPTELARDEQLVKRFQSEAAAVARLSHPNLAAVYYTGADAGRYFFAMQYIEGEPLARLLERQPQPPLEQSLDIVRQCLSGLEAAHTAGLIHRDIKPGNILLERGTGRAVLIDFGLVRRVQDGSGLTAPGAVMGSVDYIAPEQAQGKTVDARADLYAVGVLMYRLLAGQTPFSGETPTALLYQHAHEAPRPLREIAPHVPRPLAAIVQRLLNKDPALRYQTAAAVLADLQAYRRGELADRAEEAVAPRVQPVLAPAPTAKRHLWIAVAAAAAIAAAVLVTLAEVPGLFRGGEPAWDLAQASGEASGNGSLPAADDRQPTAGGEKPKAQVAGPAVLLGPGKELPQGKWVDVMTSVDPDWDTVSGVWRRGRWDGLSGTWRPQGTELTVEPGNFQRIMLPVELEGSYELKVEFTRRSGGRTILISFPVGKRACMLTLAESPGEVVHGLALVNGRKAADRDNPAVWRPGKLTNHQRYSVLIALHLDMDKAKVDVSLDDHATISWSGRQELLDVEAWWSLPKPCRPALACNDTDIVYHSALVRATDGKARMASHVSPKIELNGPHWVDLLKDVDPDRDAIQGRWLHDGGAVAVAPSSQDEKFVRLMIPRQVEGNYDLLAEFTRTKGTESVTFTLPVGSRQCTLHFSALAGLNGGLETIDGLGIGHILNPGLRRPSGLVNGKKYQMLAQVRTHDGNAVIDTWLDGKPFVHWAGHQAALELSKDWSLPERWRAGIGANQSGVTFHTVCLRPVGETK